MRVNSLILAVGVVCPSSLALGQSTLRPPDIRPVSFGDSTIGWGCYREGADNSALIVNVILDSASIDSRGSVTFAVYDRPVAYANVSIALIRPRIDRRNGTGCALDEHIVVRVRASSLDDAYFYFDPPGAVDARIFDARGALLARSVFTSPPARHKLPW